METHSGKNKKPIFNGFIETEDAPVKDTACCCKDRGISLCDVSGEEQPVLACPSTPVSDKLSALLQATIPSPHLKFPWSFTRQQT